MKRHMTLGELIDRLETFPCDLKVVSPVGAPGQPISYRGYYEDLAFMPTFQTITVGDWLAVCRVACGAVFEGYKGGNYRMHRGTRVWISDYGTCDDNLIVDVIRGGNTDAAVGVFVLSEEDAER